MNYREGNAVIDGVKIHYYRSGCGKIPFVLLHGASDNGLCWLPFAETLVKDYDVIMVDAQGHGKSDRLDDSFQYRDHADQTIGLLEELGVEKPVIMGHSMGGGTTTQIAAFYPDVPRAIILEDPAWVDQASMEAHRQKTPTADEFARMVENYGRMTEQEILAEGKNEHPVWSETELIPWAESKKQFDPTLFTRLQIDRPPYSELVPKINCPTLLITAEDGIVTQAAIETAEDLWASEHPFRWVRIKGAGHNVRREQFTDFCRAVTDFLNDIG